MVFFVRACGRVSSRLRLINKRCVSILQEQPACALLSQRTAASAAVDSLPLACVHAPSYKPERVETVQLNWASAVQILGLGAQTIRMPPAQEQSPAYPADGGQWST